MRKFEYNPPVVIPESHMADVKSLRNFIRREMNVDISLANTYRLWSDVSDYFDAGWLSITFRYDDMTRQDFLEMMMERFGTITGEE